MKLTIARLSFIFGAVVSIGIVAAIAIQKYALDHLQVNGPVYRDLVERMDLKADILPPPLYVVEAFALANDAVLHREHIDEDLAALAELKTAYDTRADFWKERELGTPIMDSLNQDVFASGEQFWAMINGGYTKALKDNDPANISLAMDDLRRLYKAQHDAVLRLSDVITKDATDVEAGAARTSMLMNTASLGSGLAALLLFMGGIVVLHRRAIQPVKRMSDFMKVMASGDYSKAVPDLHRVDEIGEMAASVEVFKAAGIERRRLEEEAASGRLGTEAEQRRMAEYERAKQQELQAFVADIERGFEALSDGDLTVRLDRPVAAEYEPIRLRYNESVDKLEDAFGSVIAGISAIRTGLSEITVASGDLSQRTEQQAASLEQTVAALSDVTAQVNEIGQRRRPGPDGGREHRAPTQKKAARSSARRSRPWSRSSTGRSRSTASSASSTRSPSRPTCSPSTPAWKRRVQATPAAALRSSPRKCAASPSARPMPPRRSRRSSPPRAIRSRTASSWSRHPASR